MASSLSLQRFVLVLTGLLGCDVAREYDERPSPSDAGDLKDAAPVHSDVGVDRSDVSTEDAGPCGPAVAMCVPVNYEAFPIDEILPGCRLDLGYADQSFTGEHRITSATEWTRFVEVCQPSKDFEPLEPDLPNFDWTHYEILGYVDDVFCPFATARLGLLACGKQLETHSWQLTDYCACDTINGDYQFYILPRGRFEGVVRVVYEEAACEDVMCDCGVENLNGCEPGVGGCLTIGYDRGSVDGAPPPWPPVPACPSPPPPAR
jgi:hypothetical protein